MTSQDEIREAFRLVELHNLAVLDTAAESEFDALVQIASDLLSCPFSTLTLVDSDRQWFKARVGVSVCETPKDISICQHAIKFDKPLVLEDLRIDPRVKDSPLVTSAPHIRAYLGVPIRSINKALVGTLCVFDTVPRKWTTQDINLVTRLTRIAEQLLHKYHAARYPELGNVSRFPGSEAESLACGAWWSNVDSTKVTMSSGLRLILGLDHSIQIDKVWFSNFGVKRPAFATDISLTPRSKQILKYDFLHPSGLSLKLEETIYCSDLNEVVEYCGVVRIAESHKNSSASQFAKSAKLEGIHPAESINVLEWIASNKVGFIQIDHDDLAHIFDSENENNCHASQPIPWEACFIKSDREFIRNEITACRLGLHTNTLFVRNALKNNHDNWLKLKFMNRSHNFQQSTHVVVEFTQMSQC